MNVVRERWSWKHRPVWARFLPRRVWERTVRFRAAWVPWSYAYRYRASRGWRRGWLG